jgi:hypothetical protein
MEHLVKPKISISRLILTVSITVGIIIYSASLLTKQNNLNRRSELVPISLREDTPIAAYQFIGSIASRMDSLLVLDSLTAKQIIEAVSKYHHIPIIYRGKRLAKQDSCFASTVNLDGNIENNITILNRLGIYVKYDGKKIIAGE